MPMNSLTDMGHFLATATSNYLHQGNWRYLFLSLYWALLLISIAIALQNWRKDPAQRTGRHLGIWLIRVLIGCLWFQGMLWKLPLSDGLLDWIGQGPPTGGPPGIYRTFIKDFILPTMTVFGPMVFVAELAFAVSATLGVAVRFVGVMAIVYVLRLWIGLYGNPSDWPWMYIFLAMLMFLFVLEGAGRSLGVDAWLRREVPAVRDGKGLVGWFFKTAG
jgi:uncharacterized membrane protein YphA (DoxX/SURF4 family)